MEKLYFGDDLKFFESDGNISLSSRTGGGGKMVRRWAMGQ